MGTIDFSCRILEEISKDHEIVLVVCQPDTYVGRKQVLTYCEVKKLALEKGFNIFQPAKIKDDYQAILDAKPDLIVTAAYGQFIPDSILKFPPYKAINVHGSLLPKHRGGAPIQRSIMNGDKETGISIIYMEKKMDAGDILAQKKIPILDDDNNTSLFSKLANLGASMINGVISDLENNKIKPIKQNEDEVSFSLNISHDEQFIDWRMDATTINNQIRGLSDEPCALTSFDGNIIKIFKASVAENNEDLEPGTIILGKKELLVKCGKNAIKILDIQLSSKNRMDIKSFLNGQKLLTSGCKFSSNIL